MSKNLINKLLTAGNKYDSFERVWVNEDMIAYVYNYSIEFIWHNPLNGRSHSYGVSKELLHAMDSDEILLNHLKELVSKTRI